MTHAKLKTKAQMGRYFLMIILALFLLLIVIFIIITLSNRGFNLGRDLKDIMPF